MTSVTQFAQYLLRLDPQKSQSRLALYNFLKHIIDPQDPFIPSVIDDFYARALNFDLWQTQAQILAQSVKEDLESFLKHSRMDESEWKNLRHADELQVVNLKHLKNFEEILSTAESSRRKSGDRFKLLRISESEVLSLYLTVMGTLEVQVFSPKAIINGSKLKPLAPVTHLYYTSGMELMPHVRHIIQGSMMTSISFYLDEQGLNGLVTRGPTFQKFETFLRARPNDNHDLFSSLKKLERHYINPQSDPYYQELVQSLERANRALQAPQPPKSTVMAAEKTLQKAAHAIKNAFPNDRLLQLLVTHLEYAIRQTTIQNTSPAGNPSAEPHSIK